jgi:hypothetical protein
MDTLVRKRLARIARRGSLPAAVRAMRREVWLRGERARLAAGLADGHRPVLAGPFAGEVGFELLFWRPYVRRLLRANGVDRERATVISRGGAGAWYRDVAAHATDVLDVVGPDDLRIGIERRVERIGQRKQVDIDDFDKLVLDRANRANDTVLVHPLHMFWGMRFVWEGLEPVERALELGDYDQLEREPAVIKDLELPGRFVAVKLYSNDTIPVTDASQRASRRLVESLAKRHTVVLLETGLAVDDHENLEAERSGNVHSVAGKLDPAVNLLQQAEIVARADALLSTYGGFSYLGPFLGVPTVAVHAVREWNPNHERVLRAARPDAAYVREELANTEAAVAALEAQL